MNYHQTYCYRYSLTVFSFTKHNTLQKFHVRIIIADFIRGSPLQPMSNQIQVCVHCSATYIR